MFATTYDDRTHLKFAKKLIVVHVTQKFIKSIMVFMDRLSALQDELAFLEEHLPELQSRPDLAYLATEVRLRINMLRQQIRALQKTNETDRRSHGACN
jgi:hypothetical protein